MVSCISWHGHTVIVMVLHFFLNLRTCMYFVAIAKRLMFLVQNYAFYLFVSIKTFQQKSYSLLILSLWIQ